MVLSCAFQERRRKSASFELYSERMTGRSFWRAIYYSLLSVFIVSAALNMLQLRVGFLTNHAADVVVPAWLYVLTRGLFPVKQVPGRLQRTFGRTPGTAAVILFTASALTEISQRYWPHGIFPGRFDPLDLIAYAAGVGGCYATERWLSRRSPPPSASEAEPDA